MIDTSRYLGKDIRKLSNNELNEALQATRSQYCNLVQEHISRVNKSIYSKLVHGI